jgi:DNA-binding transcriptional LysR family regulator
MSHVTESSAAEGGHRPDLELRHLRCVVAIADAGSVGAAARQLGVSRVTLAAQLSRIEAGLRGPLFTRSGGVVTPTVLGREVLERARAVLAEMIELVAESTRETVTTVRLVGIDGLLAPVAARFAVLRPEVRINTRVLDSYAAIDAVCTGAAEAAVTIRWPHVSWVLSALEGAARVQAYEVDREQVQVLLPDTHPLAGAELLDLAELAGEVWCARAEPALANVVTAECARHGFEPDIRYRLDSDDAIGEMVAAGRAVALVMSPVRARRGAIIRPYRHAAFSALVLVWRPAVLPSGIAHDLVAAVRGWHAERAWSPAGEGSHELGSAVRPLRVGSVAERNAIQVVPRLRTVHGIHSTMDFGTQRDLLARLQRDELDLALCQTLADRPDEFSGNWSRRTVIAGEPMVVALSAAHRVAAGRVTTESVAEVSWAVRRGSGEAELLGLLGAATGFEPRIASTYADLRQISAAVATGRLIRLAAPLEPDDDIVRRPIDDPAARRTLQLVWAHDGPAGSLVDLVAEELRLARTPHTTPIPHNWP